MTGPDKKKPLRVKIQKRFKLTSLSSPQIHPGQDVAPFSRRRGCQGFIGPDPSTFLDKYMYNDIILGADFSFQSHMIDAEVTLPGQ
jgi:hypothetical protein